MSSYLEIQYDAARQPKSFYPVQLIAQLKQRFGLPSWCSVLELGPGRGDFMKAWEDAGHHVFGADRERCDTNSVWTADLEKDRLPFDDASFDVVFSKSVIEHMWDGSNMLKEARRVRKTGGILIIMTPDWKTCQSTFYDDYTHCRPYTQESLGDAIRAAGFDMAETETFCQHPPTWRSWWQRAAGVLIRATMSEKTALWLSSATGYGLFRWSACGARLGTQVGGCDGRN